VLVSGRGVGEKIAAGPVRRIASAADIAQFKAGEVLVTDKTDPDWEPILKRASGVVTDQGGRTCHAAIIAREMGITAIVGSGDGSQRIVDGEQITVSCCEGDEGHVYAGNLPFHVDEQSLLELPPTRTRLMINVGNPEEAFKLAAIPCDGVGLARLEFIIANHIRIHPLALLEPQRVHDPAAQAAIAEQATLRERRAALHEDEPRVRHGSRVLRFVARSRHSFDRRNRPRRLLREQREQGRERGGDTHGMGLSAARAAELAEFSAQRRRARQHGPLGASAPRLTPRPIPCPQAPFPIGNKSRTTA
jgi:phosphohistidine swiveling domain-containing protein